MATNAELARQIVATYCEQWKSGRVIWNYGDLATAIGREGQHRLLGGPLDEVRVLCSKLHAPDLATVVISKDSLLDGTLQPSPKALEKYGGWPGLREEQARVMAFNWGDWYASTR